MDLDMLLQLIEQYGYAALFFALWLGIVGMPIPDEVIVMAGGLVTSLGLLRHLPAFLLTYLGVVSGLSLGYVLGYRVGAPMVEKLRRRKNLAVHLERSQALMNRYGNAALIFSYFLPVVRHVVPYLVGVAKMPFRRYALYSYTTGFVWTLLYFLLGNLFGSSIDEIGDAVTTYGHYALLVLLGGGLLVWGLRSVWQRIYCSGEVMSNHGKRVDSHHRR